MALINVPDNLRYIQEILIFDELGSTNDQALELEKTGLKSGTLLIALKQTAGRGRLCRPWVMGEGDIATTLFLRACHLPLFELSKLAWLPALAVVEALQELDMSVKLKWPNDIIINPGTNNNYDYFGAYLKIGGILVENIFKEQRVAASAIGLGLNINPNPKLKAQVPHAGNLRQLKANICSADLWPCLIKKLDDNLHRLLAPDGGDDAQARYVRHCETLGKIVTVSLKDQVITGKAIGLNQAGFLVVDDGLKHYIIYAGDVHLQV